MSNDNAKATTGPTDEVILKHMNVISSLKQAADDANSPLQEGYKRAEDAGVNKAVLKLVLKLKRMDSVKCQTFLRDLDRYIDVAGLNDQVEMYEDDEDQRQKINDNGIGADQDGDDDADFDEVEDEDDDEDAIAAVG